MSHPIVRRLRRARGTSPPPGASGDELVAWRLAQVERGLEQVRGEVARVWWTVVGAMLAAAVRWWLGG